MYIFPLLSSTLEKTLKLFAAVWVTGPRRAGRTTFLMHEYGKKSAYVSLDDPLSASCYPGPSQD